MIMETISKLRQAFNFHGLKSKALALTIEHAPCCILSAAAGFIGIPLLNHNPPIELAFAIVGAFAGEYIGHRWLHPKHQTPDTLKGAVMRYSIALAIGLAIWGIHQKLFHHPHDHEHEKHNHKHECEHPYYRLQSGTITPICP